MSTFQAKQNERELVEFIDLLRAENIRSYLEIGCKWGGSLWRVAEVLPLGAKIVAVDIPPIHERLRECVRMLRERKFDITLIAGNSTDSNVVNEVRARAPFDACLIDANHTMPYVRKDWLNYGPLCRIVALHDVSYVQVPGKLPVDVRKLWHEIKGGYRNLEIDYEPHDKGIGVLWDVGNVGAS